MWFDVQRALARIENQAREPAISANPANRTPLDKLRLAEIAGIAIPQPKKTEKRITAAVHGLHPDAKELLEFLHRAGPHTYDAAASTLDWRATRAWQAEARLRAAGLVRHDGLGRAMPIDRQ